MKSQWLKILLVIVALAALAFIVPRSGSFVVLLATRAMAFAILAMSVDLLLGFTGLSSMGQAAYFGVGAYLTAVLATKFHFGMGWDFWLVVVMGILIGAALAALFGLFAIRASWRLFPDDHAGIGTVRLGPRLSLEFFDWWRQRHQPERPAELRSRSLGPGDVLLPRVRLLRCRARRDVRHHPLAVRA